MSKHRTTRDASADAYALASVTLPTDQETAQARNEGKEAAANKVKDINDACPYPFGGVMAAAFRQGFEAEWARKK